MSLTKSVVYQNWLKGYFKSERKWIIVILLLNVIGLTFVLLEPLPLKLLADSVFSNHPAFWPFTGITNTHTLLLIAALGVFLIPVISQLYNFVSGILEQKVELRVNLRVEREILLSILKIPPRLPSRLGDGDYQYRLNDLTSSIGELAYVTFVSIARSIVFVSAMILVIFIINPLLAGIALVSVPLIYITVKKFGNKLERQTQEFTEQQSQVYDKSSDIIGHSRLIQADVNEAQQTDDYIEISRKRNRLSLNYTITASLFNLTDNAISNLTTAILVLIGGYLVFDNAITFGTLLVFISYMAILYQPLHELNTSIGDYKRQIVQIRRLYEIITAANMLSGSSGQITSAPNSEIEFSHIALKFKNDVLCQDVSFVLPAGKKLAIIGPSGSGKSSLLDILPRFAIPSDGQVKIGGVGLEDWDLAALRHNIAMVEQSPEILNDTILANITYGTNSHPNEPLLPAAAAAAQKANALGFIEKMPDNFYTIIGGKDVQLSGGQAQRICLARAIMKGSPILLLDEPTSALDSGSRKAVLEAIKHTMTNKTVIIATHDLDLLRAVDYVATISNQSLVFVRTSEELTSYLEKVEKEAQHKPFIGTLDISSLLKDD